MSRSERANKRKKRKKLVIFLVVLLLLGIVAGGAGLVSFYYNTYVNIEAIYPGISIGDMDMGNLSMEEAQKKVDDYVAGVMGSTVTLEAGEKNGVLVMSDLGLSWANPEVVTEAYNLGKSGNLFERIKTVYQLNSIPKNYPILFSFDQDIAREKIIELEKTFLAKKKNATIKKKKKKFVVTKEVNGMDMDLEKNADALLALLADSDWHEQSLVFPLEYKEDKAEHTYEQLSAIKNKLGTFTTSYAGSTSGRCANVENGARLINKTLLYPGDVFSVYKAVSPFEKENGYELAGSYENGTTVQTYGGGICQVSTTLYNAVLRAELKIKERSNHSMTVHYVELSEDAAIAGDYKDFKFENNLKYPVYIEGKTNHDKRTITFTIYGKEYRSKDRSIEFVSETTSTTPPKEERIKDDKLEKGKKEVEKQGHTGYTARLWKIIHQKGKKDEKKQINSSSYISTPTVIRVGTKEKPKKKEEKKTDQTQTDQTGQAADQDNKAADSGNKTEDNSSESSNNDMDVPVE